MKMATTMHGKLVKYINDIPSNTYERVKNNLQLKATTSSSTSLYKLQSMYTSSVVTK